MPKVVYCCEFCGEVFKTEYAATKCEGTHRAIFNVKPAEYNDSDRRYPSSISCSMSNGAVVRYVLDRIEKDVKD